MNEMIRSALILFLKNKKANNQSAEHPLSKEVFEAPTEMSNDFTGYTVVIATSDCQLDKKHKIFSQFGGVLYKVLNNKFYYFIGKFKTKEGALKYAESTVKKLYQQAEVLTFINGSPVFS